MVGDNNVNAEAMGFFDGSDTGDTAIGGNNQADALLMERFDGGNLQAVPFIDTVRDIGKSLDIKSSQSLDKTSGREVMPSASKSP